MRPIGHSARAARTTAAAAFLLLGAAALAQAQAFTPPKGEGSVTLTFADSLVKKHYFGPTEVDRGRIRMQAMAMELGYGITDRVAVGVSLPWIHAKYTGVNPHPALPGQEFPDDGSYRSGVQDWRVDARYNLTRSGVAVITPYVALTVPSHDYIYFAHAALGRQLKEVQFGVFTARLLDDLVPGLFVQTRLSVGIPERTLDYRPIRNNADIEIGYFVNESVRVFALGMGQLTHGGLDIPTPGVQNITNPLFVHHDQIGRENGVKLGTGMAWSINDRIDVFGSVSRTLAARNGHAFAYNAQTGVTVSFGKRGGASKAAPTAAEAAATATCHGDHDTKKNALARCICMKGA